MLQYISDNRIKCESPLGDIFIIQSKVIVELNTFIQYKSFDPESGGILVGRTDKNTKAKIIESFTYPVNEDKQTITSFYRSKKHNNILQNIWKQSEQFLNFQGLWHTHPEDTPSPSQTDLKDIQNVFTSMQNFHDPFLYLIVGRIRLGVWISFRNNTNIHLGYIKIRN